MSVPLLDVNAQNLPLEDEFKVAFERVLHSGRFIMGSEVTDFEERMCQMLGVKHAIGVSSGTDAILLGLMALGIGAGDEVILPSFTFFATGGCVARTGATPVFVDACPYCFNAEPEDIEALITPKTKAIIPVHLFGQAAEMDEIMAIAEKHNLKVIEDSAQALGARYRGKCVGTLGDFGTYSFFPSKNLGGFGDSGLLVTQDDTLAQQARIMRMHGSEPKYYHQCVGGNFRMDPLQSAMLSIKLNHYGDYTEKRQANARFYMEALAQLPGVAINEADTCGSEDLAEDIRILLPNGYAHNEHIWNQYTLRVITKPGENSQRDALRAHLQAKSIGCEVYYPLGLHQQECFAHLPNLRKSLPVTERLASEVISIPIYPELSDAQKEEVVGEIAAFLSL